MTDKIKALLLTIAGVMILVPDTLLIRLADIDPWRLLFWRFMLASMVFLLLIGLQHRRSTVLHFLNMGRAGLGLALLSCLGNHAFVLALEDTTVANLLIILALAPLFSALMSRIFLNESIAGRTWLAILGCLAGIILLVSDSLGGLSLRGDLLALFSAFSIGSTFTLLRVIKPNSILPAYFLGWALASLLAIPFCSSFLLPSNALIPVLIGGLLVIPFSFLLISYGPRVLPAPEVALLMLLETIMGPFLVWLVLGEEPGRFALLGGSVVVGMLFWHSLAGLISWKRLRRRYSQ